MGSGREFPQWLHALDEEDVHFIRRFVLASGSLKALGTEYGVSYPTLRARLDRLIAKIRAVRDDGTDDVFEQTLRVMVAGGKIDADSARQLLATHRKRLNEEEAPE